MDRQWMTPLSQSREDAQELNKPLVTPKTQKDAYRETVTAVSNDGSSQFVGPYAAKCNNRRKMKY